MYSDWELEAEVVRPGMVSAVDESVGRLLAALRTTGHYNNTLIGNTYIDHYNYRICWL